MALSGGKPPLQLRALGPGQHVGGWRAGRDGRRHPLQRLRAQGRRVGTAWDAKVDGWLADEAKAAPAKEAALTALRRAREGTSLLRRHLRPLGPLDWAFLASQADGSVGAALATRAAPLGDERLAARAKLDRFVGDFLDRFGPEECACVPCSD